MRVKFGGEIKSAYLCTTKTTSRGGAVVARWAHNPKVAGSSPVPATKTSLPVHNEPEGFFRSPDECHEKRYKGAVCFFRGIVKIRKAVSELRSSGMVVAPSRVTMKNGGRRPEFFMVARHGVDDKFHIMGIEDVR